ncbi:ATP synthase F0 subunit B [Salidesulfovibrio onnuriiensis]|uniref:ATP synthase F0 subunit B n=1 Tax=Salidesulfovibrio onnuriiensis TaxID=2583823 RepID=UPI0011C73D9F|nr:ATP synthase F0 subunit B [Salidesulfovibrio onnuriiensis]
MIDIHPLGLLIQAINFLVTLVVLNFLLLKPVRGIIRKRKEHMASQLSQIEKFTADADGKLKNYEEQLAVARKDGNEIRAQYKDQATVEETKLLSAAGEDAASTLKAAHAEIQSQVKTAMDQLSKDVEAFAAKATDKILGQA